jgi:ketosteroid isomerase-like protein
MTPEDINLLFAQAYNDQNLDQLLELYEDGAVLAPAPGAPLVSGLEAIRESLKPFVALGGRLSLVKRRYSVVSGELALISIDFALSGARAPDGSPLDMTGTTTEVARRQPDGRWKYVVDLPFSPP